MPDANGNLTDDEKRLLGLASGPQPSVPSPQPRGEDPMNPSDGRVIESPLPPAISDYESLFPKDNVFGGSGIDQLSKRSSDAIQNRLREGELGEDISRSPASEPPAQDATSTSTAPADKKATSKKSEVSVQDLKDLQARLSNARPGMNTKDAIDTLLGNNASQMQGAQQTANSNRLIAMLGQAGSTVGSALTPLSKEKPNTEFFKNLEQAANQPVQDVLTQQASQQSEMKGALEKRQLQEAMDASDPNSDKSVALRKAYEKAFPGIDKSYGKYWSSVSAADAPLIAHPLELRAKLDEQLTNALANREFKQGLLNKKGDEKQGTATNQTMGMLESARGNPEVSGALRNKLLVKNAASLINQYPDPNNMSPAEVSLLVTEIGKIASGGVPAEKELQTIMPNTMKSNLASMYSKLANNPQPAQAGAFIKKYQNYLQELDNNANDTINTKYNRVLEGQKSRIGDDSYNNLKENYTAKPVQFKNKGAQQSTSFPADVMKYAEDHNITPEQAAAVKAQRTQGNQ